MALALGLGLATLLACARESEREGPRVGHWLVGRTAPTFDPDGPPDEVRAAIERQLSVGLVERDSAGVPGPGLAERHELSPDGLVWTFHLRRGMRFTDGTPLTADAVREALVAGLARTDHATRAWELAAVEGVQRVTRDVRKVGIECPDDHTVRVRLAHPAPDLLERLARPGVGVPFRARQGSWSEAVGVGPWRVAQWSDRHSLTLVAADTVVGRIASCDTLHIRFVTGAARVLGVVRDGGADFAWPLPAGVVDQRLPEDWRLESRPARPWRRLLLVLRGDLAPTSSLAVRASLVQGIDRDALGDALGVRGAIDTQWLPDATQDVPWPLPPIAVEPNGTGRRPSREPSRPVSHHVVLAYDPDGTTSDLARDLQGMWARAGHYADLRAQGGAKGREAALASSGAQARLVEVQDLIPEGPGVVEPWSGGHGAAVGGFRSGLRGGLPEPWEPDSCNRLLVRERVVLPVARLPWLWALRDGAPRPAVHPALGPEWWSVGTVAGRPGTR